MIIHKHHIVPKHVGGDDDPSNLIELTVEEHAEAHRLLYEEHGRKEDWLAWQGLSGMIGKDVIIKQLMFLGQQKGGKNCKGLKRGSHSEERKEIIRHSCLGKNKGKTGMAKEYTGFIDPLGNNIIIKNLYKFCRDNNLNQSCMCRLASGNLHSHKGWTFKG